MHTFLDVKCFELYPEGDIEHCQKIQSALQRSFSLVIFFASLPYTLMFVYTDEFDYHRQFTNSNDAVVINNSNKICCPKDLLALELGWPLKHPLD